MLPGARAAAARFPFGLGGGYTDVMRILLVAVNARYTHSSLALRYLRNALTAEAERRGIVIELALREYNISQPRMEVTRDMAA